MNYTEKAKQLAQAMEELHYAYFNAYQCAIQNNTQEWITVNRWMLEQRASDHLWKTLYWHDKPTPSEPTPEIETVEFDTN